MTGPHSDTESSATRPISVAELLARNGTIGAPAVTRRRRRRRGDSDAVTVAELTGEIPVIRDDHVDAGKAGMVSEAPARVTEAPARVTEAPAEPAEADSAIGERPKSAYWSEPEPRWPRSAPPPHRESGPERSEYPRPLRRDTVERTVKGTLDHTPGHMAEHIAEPAVEHTAQKAARSGAEDMSPDPVDHYADTSVDAMDAEVREAEPAAGDSAYVRSYLRDSDSTLFGGQTLADELARRVGAEAPAAGTPAGEGENENENENENEKAKEKADHAGRGLGVRGVRDRLEALWRGTVVVFQCVLAVAFGAGLFMAFDQLWRWNSIVALVLSVLVILGLVVGVRVVRKTEDIASTLIAVAVGALITLGPLALSLQSG